MTKNEYLRNVGHSLNDLPWGVRRDLLAEIRGHIDELPAIGAVVWISSYQPLAWANATQEPLDSTPSPGQPGVTVVFRKGHPYLYGISNRNNGRFTVRVLGVPTDVMDFYAGPLLMSRDTTARMDEFPLERFHPFDLKPGSFRWLVFKGVFACTTGMTASGGTVTREDMPVRYSFLWRTATASIPLDDPRRSASPRKAAHPRRPRRSRRSRRVSPLPQLQRRSTKPGCPAGVTFRSR